MVRGLYISATGMTNQMQMMDVISNNIANADTTSYKKDTLVSSAFQNELLKRIKKDDSESIGNIRHGVGTNAIMSNFTQGSLKNVGGDLNVAIDGTGFIAIKTKNPNGEITEKYTRDGAFSLDNNGYLVTKDGDMVSDANGNDIFIGKGKVSIDDRGQIFVNDNEVAKIKLVDFEDLNLLKKSGANLYETFDEAKVKPFTSRIEQGFLEGSNVNSVKEMVEMISMSRTYEANQKAIQTHDTMLEKAVNQVGRVN